MAINVRSYSNLTKKDVFTNKGIYCGKITDIGLDLDRFRVKSIIVDAVRGSFLASMVGDKKGVVIPFTMVQSVGDIVIIKHITPQTVEDEPRQEEQNN